ncbi:MAG: hypothetical protein Kow0090_01380 [Myxococcota bacterium]
MTENRKRHPSDAPYISGEFLSYHITILLSHQVEGIKGAGRISGLQMRELERKIDKVARALLAVYREKSVKSKLRRYQKSVKAVKELKAAFAKFTKKCKLPAKASRQFSSDIEYLSTALDAVIKELEAGGSGVEI